MKKILIAALVLLQVTPRTAFGSEASPGFSLLQKHPANVREFFSFNKDNRFVIRVHVWGDVPGSGIYYIPDNAKLLDVMGYAGGPMGVLKDSDVTIYRTAARDDKESRDPIEVSGSELLSDSYRDMPLRDGDVIHWTVPPKVDHTMRTLTIISLVVGFISTTALVYMAVRNR